jgi:hypothetical protein
MTNDKDSGYYCPVMGAWIIKAEASLRQPTQIDVLSSFVDIVREAVIEECAKALEADAIKCDCAALEEGECCCGAWDDYKSIMSARAAEIVRALKEQSK